uniref:ZZ-type domain-containing protein n=1 Tax=Davidia involucrata TaxID=16924 RepID=A0A5B7C0L9_DAVIN
MDSALVIKVKYSDTLRRFTAYVDENGLLDLDMAGLKMKIHCLFRFSPDADLTMTYIDEDKDEVTLVDDDDLCNATRQNLNPLRINVQLSSIRDRGSESKVNKSYAPKGPVRVERLLTHIVSNDNEISKSPEEPMPNVLSTLSHELTTKATSLLLTKFMECLSKLELSKPGPVSESQDGASLSREELTSNFSMCPKVNKDLELPEINAKLVDPAPTKLLKVLETGCMAKPVENSTPPSAAPVDINADHPRDSTASAFSNLNFPDPASASDVLSHNNEEKSLKENVVLTGKSIALESSTSITDVLTHVNLHPFQTSQISFSDDRGSFALNCENIKKHPGGTEQFLASQANVDPAGKLPDLGFMTGDKSLDKGFNGVDSYDALPSPYNARFSNKSYSNSDSSSRIFHKGIQCDGCGVYPIMGPRFKSKVKKDFDLCNICFLLLDLGNEAEYIRLDRPISHQAPWCSINFRDHSCGRRMFDSRLYDLSIMGSTVIAPNVRFTKKWRMCNSGAAAWPHGTELVWIGGDRVTDRVSVEVEIPVEGFLVDKELDIGVDFTAPIRPGHYVSYWKMSLPSGLTFGQCILVHIQVDASLQGSAVSFHGINLNVPANTCMVEEGKEINDMDNSLPEAGHFEVTAEVVKPKPVVDDEPTIGNVVTPGVDSSKVPSESFITSISPEVVKNSNEFEQALIRELEQMGFKQIDLNKEILRMNAYDLEQSIADLCGLVE